VTTEPFWLPWRNWPSRWRPSSAPSWWSARIRPSATPACRSYYVSRMPSVASRISASGN